MSSRRTSGWWLILASLLLVVAIAGGGWVLFDRYVRPPPSPVAPVVASLPSPVEEPIGEAVVVAVEGSVERSTDGGPWSSLQKGERLRANDAIRTGANAKAELEVDKNSSVVLTSGSEVGIREISRAVHRFKLTRGQMKADYREDGSRALRIEGSGAEVKTAGAKFSVLAAGDSFAVATETGKVNLEAAGESVEVGAGEQSIARAGGAPDKAAPIPTSLLLKIAAAKKGKGCSPIEGRVAPGSEVLVDGNPVPLDASGAFRYRPDGVPRASVTVVTRDPSGRSVERVVLCRRRDEPAIKDFAIRWRPPTQN